MMKILIVFLSFLLISCKGEKPHVVSVLAEVDSTKLSLEAIDSWMTESGLVHDGSTSNMLNFSFIPNNNSGDLNSNEISFLNSYFELVKSWLTPSSNVQFIGFIVDEFCANCSKLIKT